MNLDFSTRESTGGARGGSSADVVSSSKRPLSPTPDDVKRLCSQIGSVFELGVSVHPCADDIARPPTPDDLLNLRALIDAEAGGLPTPVPVPVGSSPPPNENVFKHAGLLREDGGIRGWLKMRKRERGAVEGGSVAGRVHTAKSGVQTRNTNGAT